METWCMPSATYALKSEQYAQLQCLSYLLKLLCNFTSEMRLLHLIHAAMTTTSMQVRWYKWLSWLKDISAPNAKINMAVPPMCCYELTMLIRLCENLHTKYVSQNLKYNQPFQEPMKGVAPWFHIHWQCLKLALMTTLVLVISHPEILKIYNLKLISMSKQIFLPLTWERSACCLKDSSQKV